MKAFLLFVLLIFTSNTFSQNFPHLFELRGLEDSLGNTHLFYRHVYPSASCWSKSIYHFDFTNNYDTLFIQDSGGPDPFYGGCKGQFIYDYQFFNDDPAKFICGGYDLWIDPLAIIVRYDGEIQIPSFGGITDIEISQQNDSLVYAALGEGLYKSTDGGYNFTIDFDSLAWIDNSMISLSQNDDLQIYGINDNKLVRSEDEGYNYIIVDNDYWMDNSELFYDPDGNHIYGLSISYNYQNQSYSSKIYKSGDNGNPFTWNTILEYPAKIWFSLDQYQTGEIYYATGKQIFKSTNFGNTFLLYKTLHKTVTGLYKKSGSEILYVSTPLKIYEITPDSTQVIKSLPIPEEVFAWYPLNLGDTWIYHKTFYVDGDSLNWVSIVKVEANKILENNVYSKVLVTDIGLDSLSQSGDHYEYFRTDSSYGKVYQAWIENDSLLYEELYMDLLVEVGDTIPVGNGIYLESEEPITIFGLNSRKRTFMQTQTPIQRLELVNGLGRTYEYLWELAESEMVLKGCIIDDVVYGDTTVVSVDDETPNLPTSFKLEQNYPNPFNPSTMIRYEIPGQARNDNMLVVLKVYDVLGNEIATLVNEEKPAGTHEVKFSATALPSGIYFYRIQSGEFIQTKKMILLR